MLAGAFDTASSRGSITRYVNLSRRVPFFSNGRKVSKTLLETNRQDEIVWVAGISDELFVRRHVLELYKRNNRFLVKKYFDYRSENRFVSITGTKR